MPVYLCRWPNGDLTVVGAPSKQEAIVLLDEFGNADHADIFQVAEFLADFRLTDRGEFELSRFGEAADDRIMEKAYPLLWKAMLSDAAAGLDENSKEYRKVIHAAVQEERTRLQRTKKICRKRKRRWEENYKR
ncbi:MAG: hypothetical protein ABR568_07770, partial [Pyrinomonadaceae bacterium]